jgi:hypothetical protein
MQAILHAETALEEHAAQHLSTKTCDVIMQVHLMHSIRTAAAQANGGMRPTLVGNPSAAEQNTNNQRCWASQPQVVLHRAGRLCHELSAKLPHTPIPY